jgi:hypothetical protein
MRSFLFLFVLLALVTSAKAQIDTESIPPSQDQNDLFARAAASRLVIIGRVLKSEGVSKRIPPESLEEHLKNGTALGGSLVTVQVEETVCRQSDFSKNSPKTDDSQPFYLFVPFDESALPDGHYREVLLPNHRYMLLLDALDSQTLSKTYLLDPGRNYYRGQGQNRGVIPLEAETSTGRAHNPPDVVNKFRKLCTAMKPANPADKLASLQQLADSGDPVLAREAENAKRAVKTEMAPEQEPGTKPH